MRQPKCRTCGKEHALGICPEFHKADEPKKSTAARLGLIDVAPTDVQLGVPKPKVGRPSTGFDRNAYQREYMADWPKAKALGMTVSEYRKGKEND